MKASPDPYALVLNNEHTGRPKPSSLSNQFHDSDELHYSAQPNRGYSGMKSVAAIAVLFCCLPLQAQCLRTEFSGEARWDAPFSEEIGNRVRFSVNPKQGTGIGQRWFSIRAIQDDAGTFVFNIADTNWILALSDFWSAYIGGVHVDVGAALKNRSRHLLFPVSAEDYAKTHEALVLINTAKTAVDLRAAITALLSVRLAHVSFEILDYELGNQEPPTAVEWVRFQVTLTLPPDFPISTGLPVAETDCPAIPGSLIANIRNPKQPEDPEARRAD